MRELTSRERVLRVVHHEKPDKVPRRAGFTPAIYEKFREATGEANPEEYFQMDTRYVWPSPSRQQHDFSRFFDTLPEGTIFDEWGTAYSPGSMYHFMRYHFPMGSFQSVQEVEEYPWPDLEAEYRYEGLVEHVEKLKRAGHFVIGGVGHIFETSWGLRGMDKLFEDFFEHPEMARAILDRVTEMRRAMAVAYAEAGVDMILCGDDVGMQDRLMMSPSTWREWFKPRWHSVWATARKVNPELTIFYHSDGKLEPVIPDLIEIGMNVLNPVQPECMDPAALKREFGDEIVLWGCIGTQTTMPFGTPEDVRAAVGWTIEHVGYDGGLFLEPTHVLEPEVPWENIEAFFKACDELGRHD